MYDEYFLNRRKQPRLWPSAVLFIDLLGVRQLATDGRRVGIHLRELSEALRHSVRDFLDPGSPWPAAFFSDSLVIVAPITTGDVDGEEALGGLIAQTAWLQWDLTVRGFFVRGGITVGKVHLREGLLFGPALVDAYDIESRRAVHPRIVLGGPARDVMGRSLSSYAQPAAAPHNWELLRDDDGEVFVDYITAGVTDGVIDPEADLKTHRDLIATRLTESRRSGRVWEKYKWAADYHNVACGRLWKPAQARKLLVPQTASTRGFTTYV